MSNIPFCSNYHGRSMVVQTRYNCVFNLIFYLCEVKGEELHFFTYSINLNIPLSIWVSVLFINSQLTITSRAAPYWVSMGCRDYGVTATVTIFNITHVFQLWRSGPCMFAFKFTSPEFHTLSTFSINLNNPFIPALCSPLRTLGAVIMDLWRPTTITSWYLISTFSPVQLIL